jgi:hypothetical protein
MIASSFLLSNGCRKTMRQFQLMQKARPAPGVAPDDFSKPANL